MRYDVVNMQSKVLRDLPSVEVLEKLLYHVGQMRSVPNHCACKLARCTSKTTGVL